MELNQIDNKPLRDQFEALCESPRQTVMSDSGAIDWRQHWWLDGHRARIDNMAEGMVFEAGPIAGDDASHAVLWSRNVFEGDIRIEFDYTRHDTINRYVNILFLHATGEGTPPYAEDIAAWSHLRRIPSMSTYFNHMHLLHISFAAFSNNNDEADDYVRMRRYPVTRQRSFKQLAVPPDYNQTGLFEPGVSHHIIVIKKGPDVFMHVASDSEQPPALLHWNTAAFPELTRGRVGIRQMATRCSMYSRFQVSQLLA